MRIQVIENPDVAWADLKIRSAEHIVIHTDAIAIAKAPGTHMEGRTGILIRADLDAKRVILISVELEALEDALKVLATMKEFAVPHRD